MVRGGAELSRELLRTLHEQLQSKDAEIARLSDLCERLAFGADGLQKLENLRSLLESSARHIANVSDLRDQLARSDLQAARVASLQQSVEAREAEIARLKAEVGALTEQQRELAHVNELLEQMVRTGPDSSAVSALEGQLVEKDAQIMRLAALSSRLQTRSDELQARIEKLLAVQAAVVAERARTAEEALLASDTGDAARPVAAGAPRVTAELVRQRVADEEAAIAVAVAARPDTQPNAPEPGETGHTRRQEPKLDADEQPDSRPPDAPPLSPQQMTAALSAARRQQKMRRARSWAPLGVLVALGSVAAGGYAAKQGAMDAGNDQAPRSTRGDGDHKAGDAGQDQMQKPGGATVPGGSDEHKPAAGHLASAPKPAASTPGRDMIAKISAGDTSGALAAVESAADADVRDTHGRTGLMVAAARGDDSVIDALTKRDANVNAKSPDGWTPLMLAARYDRANSVRLLLDLGADARAKTNSGVDALSIARGSSSLRAAAVLQAALSR